MILQCFSRTRGFVILHVPTDTTAQALADTLSSITAQIENDMERWSQLAEFA